MTTLKELVDRQRFSGEDDTVLIAEWFEKNDMAIKGIEIISKLSTNKIKNDEWKYGTLIGDLRMYGITRPLIKEFGIEDGLELDYTIRNYIICKRLGQDFEKEYPQCIEWLKYNIPKHTLPIIFWRDFAEYLESLNIHFKEDNKDDNKRKKRKN